ncbi:hypothetical protein COLO4_28264 [Corchorus olitorius]|uniref:Peptidase M16 N-terminal domain-containing protein n=1 Tax=Corchorus olitorius TaxID=93759 RepID=A0A1R3HM16_9ROSI|nr:hypothetical protein COLO4_28264 [Corchorus olitorius]
MGNADATEEMEEIVKARTDRREYKKIVLRNSLQSAACMSVGVGYFSDPDGLEGLAHFLMRLLPHASGKYPSEASYQNYITEQGGYTNSTVSVDFTEYHFGIKNDCFEEALDR